MGKTRILFVCAEPSLAVSVASDLRGALGASVRVIADVEGGSALAATGHFRLILVAKAARLRCDEIGGLLGACASGRRPIPVVVAAPRYDEAEALTLFRMGVADYLCLRDHREAFAGVIGSLIASPIEAPHAEDSAPVARDRPVPVPLPLSQRF